MEKHEIDDDKARCLAIQMLVKGAWQIVAGTPRGATLHDTITSKYGKVPPALKFFGSHEQCETIQRGCGGKLHDTIKSYNHRGHWQWEIMGNRAIEIAYEVLPLLQAGGPLQKLAAIYMIRNLEL